MSPSEIIFHSFTLFTCTVLTLRVNGAKNLEFLSSKRISAIVGGSQSQFRPFFVRINFISRSGFCGGTLIDWNWVLTAAICVEDTNGEIFIRSLAQTAYVCHRIAYPILVPIKWAPFFLPGYKTTFVATSTIVDGNFMNHIFAFNLYKNPYYGSSLNRDIT